MKKKNGFTLIELLAVIIILGILMIIAIPAVTKYINDSKKTTYVNSAKSIAGGARNLANSGDLDMSDPNSTYYIPASYIKAENNGLKTPYGDLTEAYVGVITDGNSNSYYWVSRDSSGTGIRDITPIDKLESSTLESDIPANEISNTIRTTGIGNRTNIKILQQDGTWDTIVLSGTSNNIGEDGNVVDNLTYPVGKSRSTVSPGDLVSIGTEEFYVVKRQGKNLVLLSHYNLRVGYVYENSTRTKTYSSSDEGYGIQGSDVLGLVLSGASKGLIGYAESAYWANKVGTDYPGVLCDYTSNLLTSNCANMYDSNSTLYQYVENYKTYLEGLGLGVKEARLLSVNEAAELGCSNDTGNCSSAPAFVTETSYWLGSPAGNSAIWGVFTFGELHSDLAYGYYYGYGVRPVIVV